MVRVSTYLNFARKADVSYAGLTKVDIGVIKKPLVVVASKIAKALNVGVGDLIK